MKPSRALKNFILREDIRNLIASNNFSQLYEEAGDLTPELTCLLYAADVDPLRHMDYIPENFLYGTSIAGFSFYPHLKEIRASAFRRCERLLKIAIPGNIKRIGEGAFLGCRKLIDILLEDGVQEIGAEAFANCYELVDMSIPRSVREIGVDVVWGNYDLSKIKYEGTMTDWKDIKIHKNNERLQTCIILCNDGALKWEDSQWNYL